MTRALTPSQLVALQALVACPTPYWLPTGRAAESLKALGRRGLVVFHRGCGWRLTPSGEKYVQARGAANG